MKIVPERVKGELCVASKFAVNGLSEALRMELRPAGVSVTVFCPYWVVTGFLPYKNSPAARKRATGLKNTAYLVGDSMLTIILMTERAWLYSLGCLLFFITDLLTFIYPP
jgi:short-subunit dehydrogenase